eukprot:GHVL01000121.1.p1 GENE.GHVL01000121.1~~GHVL01000121.1.p1  ORF type:complete len:199 (+),score=34.24 GHVL01000121.1:81-677(+)
MVLAFFEWIFSSAVRLNRHHALRLSVDDENFEFVRVSAKRGGVLQAEAESQAIIIAKREMEFIASLKRPVKLGTTKARQFVPRCNHFLKDIMCIMGMETHIHSWPVQCETVAKDVFSMCQDAVSDNDDTHMKLDFCCASNLHLYEFILLLERLSGISFGRRTEDSNNVGFAAAIRLVTLHNISKVNRIIYWLTELFIG